MSAGSFEFRFRHQNEEATWYKNPNTKFALPMKMSISLAMIHI